MKHRLNGDELIIGRRNRRTGAMERIFVIRQKMIIDVERWLIEFLGDGSWSDDRVECQNSKTENGKNHVETRCLLSKIFGLCSIDTTAKTAKGKYVQV